MIILVIDMIQNNKNMIDVLEKGKQYRITLYDGSKQKMEYEAMFYSEKLKTNMYVFSAYKASTTFSEGVIIKLENYETIHPQIQAKAISEDVHKQYLKFGFAMVNGKKIRTKYIYKPVYEKKEK